MKAIIYHRTIRGANDDKVSEAILVELHNWADKLGCKVVETYIDDKPYRGSDQLVLKRAIDIVQSDHTTLLIAYDMNRLSMYSLSTTIDLIRSLGDQLVLIYAPPNSMIAECALFNEQKRKERSTIANIISKERGDKVGRPSINVDMVRLSMLVGGGMSITKASSIVGCSPETARQRLIGIGVRVPKVRKVERKKIWEKEYSTGHSISKGKRKAKNK